MIDESMVPHLINYISGINRSCSYIIKKVDNLQGEFSQDVLDSILKEYTSIDTIVSEIIRDYPCYRNNFLIDEIELPALLRKNGYLIRISNQPSSFFGRTSELLKIKVIMAKKVKNNVLLIGEPGVGKTRLVEEYARRENKVNIFAVECAKLIGDCEYRGAFEQKVVDLLDYSERYGLVLFFDEIHSLINLGKSVGGMSITDILKPYLLNPVYRFIGATTVKESVFFLQDEAFRRRFSILFIDEPTYDVLYGIKANFEQLVLKDSVVKDEDTEYLFDVLKDKLPTLRFPDKLLDFLDFLYAYKEISPTPVNFKEILEDYVHDQQQINS